MAVGEASPLTMRLDELLTRPGETPFFYGLAGERPSVFDDQMLADLGRSVMSAADARRHLWGVAAAKEFSFGEPEVQAAFDKTAPYLDDRDSVKFVTLASETLDYNAAVAEREEELREDIAQLRSNWFWRKADANLSKILNERALRPAPPDVLSNEWIIEKAKAFASLPRRVGRFFHEAPEEHYNKVMTRVIIGGLAVMATTEFVVGTVLAARGFNTSGNLTHQVAALGNHLRPPEASHGHDAHSDLLLPSQIVGKHAAPRTEQLPYKVKPGEFLWDYMHRAGIPARKIMSTIADAFHQAHIPFTEHGEGAHAWDSYKKGQEDISTTQGILSKIGEFISWPSRR